MSINPCNKYFTQSPIVNYHHLKTREILSIAAAVISYVALAAITTFVLLISYGSIGVLGVQPGWMLAGSVLISIASAIGGGYLLSRSHSYAQKAAIEYGVHQKLEEVKNWSDDQIQCFLDGHALHGNSPEPVDFRPMIARYQFFDGLRQEKEESVYNIRQNLSQEADADIQRIARMNIWDLQNEALEQKINSAICLQIMQQPYNCALDTIQADGSIAQMAQFHKPSFYKNLYLESFGEPNPAISFAIDARRSDALSRTAVAVADADDLRRMLFESQEAFYSLPTTPRTA